MALLNDRPCPRCGCYLRAHFACNCGEVHSDYCANCNRWIDLPPNEHITLDEIDEPCTRGSIPHEHSRAEKADRIQAFVRRNVPYRGAR